MIYLKLEQGVPQYVYTGCGSCRSIFGKSLCSIKNRGCCWYFPKFSLHEIHKMAKNPEGTEILQNMRKLPGVVIYNYYIHAKGYFDEKGYKSFLESGQAYKYDVEDKSVFFRACPYVRPGKGCILPVEYRSCVCNFFICREAVEEVSGNNSFEEYIKERDKYVRWIEWQNYSLEMLLKENGLTLAKNFDGVIEALKDISLEYYEFPQLPPLETEGGFYIGA